MKKQDSFEPVPGAPDAAPRRSGWGWALAPFLILGSGLAGLAVMTALAVDDPSFALEPDYYRKAVELDTQRAQEAQNRALGWQLRLEALDDATAPGAVQLRVSLADPKGALNDARVEAVAFHNARASEVREVVFLPEGAGRYRARLTRVKPGLWEVRLRVERLGVVFTSVERLMLPQGGEG